jgi:hypothetical protein
MEYKRDYLCVADGDSRLESATSSKDAREITLKRLYANKRKSVRVSVSLPAGPTTQQILLESEEWVLIGRKWVRKSLIAWE